MYLSHVWMDYAFLTTIAHLGKKSKAIVGSRYYRIVLVAFGLILAYYGATFVLEALKF